LLDPKRIIFEHIFQPFLWLPRVILLAPRVFLASEDVLPATISSSLISGLGVNSVVQKKIFDCQ